MSPEEWERLERSAEAELMRIPGVTRAYEETRGKATDRAALRVSVREKKPKSALADAELIPETFRSMSAVLKAKGSPELRKALEEHEEEVLAHDQHLDDLHALADELAQEPGARTS